MADTKKIWVNGHRRQEKLSLVIPDLEETDCLSEPCEGLRKVADELRAAETEFEITVSETLLKAIRYAKKVAEKYTAGDADERSLLLAEINE